MARPGVTYFDISRAAEAVKAQGNDPTIDRVREQLGTGSKSTIAPLLKQWRANNEPNMAESKIGLPADLINAVKSLRECIHEDAEEAVEQAKQDYHSRVQVLERNLKGKENELAESLGREQKQNNQIAELESSFQKLTNEFSDLQTLHAVAESDRNTSQTRIKELKELAAELKEENRAVRDHFEHYQQRTADDRQLEREQFQSQLRGLQSQSDTLTNQLALAHKEKDSYKQRYDQAKEYAETLSADNQQKKHELSNCEEKIKVLAASCEGKSKEILASNEKYSFLQADCINLKEQLALRNAALASVEAELQQMRSKAERLDAENREVIEEKAMLQGRLVQLQTSLNNG